MSSSPMSSPERAGREKTPAEVTELVDGVMAMIPEDDPWLVEAQAALDRYWTARRLREQGQDAQP